VNAELKIGAEHKTAGADRVFLERDLLIPIRFTIPPSQNYSFELNLDFKGKEYSQKITFNSSVRVNKIPWEVIGFFAGPLIGFLASLFL
jgi:hypothetical protein